MGNGVRFEIDYLQYLDAEGQLLNEDLPDFARDRAQLVGLYQEMLKVRCFDAKAVALQRTGKLGTYASCIGHEAAHVGIGSGFEALRGSTAAMGASKDLHQQATHAVQDVDR